MLLFVDGHCQGNWIEIFPTPCPIDLGIEMVLQGHAALAGIWVQSLPSRVSGTKTLVLQCPLSKRIPQM